VISFFADRVFGYELYSMKKKDTKSYFKDGTIIENLPNTMFRVNIGDEKVILATLKGAMRRRYVRLFPGDRVTVEMSEYDKERGRIVQKYGR
jgi:translation initiation factor IF-1